jgi:uncharacterized membrane protein YkvA (DUF1232 family)
MGLMNKAREASHRLRRDAHMLWIAARDSRTPFVAKAVAGFVAAYALSPIDLIPDFVPLFGLLDELVVVPLGLAIAIRLVPADLLAEFRHKADLAVERPVSLAGAVLVIGLWVTIAVFLALQLWALRYW